ncbi:MAG TPA: hypothetical protein VFN67_33385 [Polyangiales bacterium]|nr:hypothetical protein [Polyangiales bacterium]
MSQQRFFLSLAATALVACASDAAPGGSGAMSKAVTAGASAGSAGASGAHAGATGAAGAAGAGNGKLSFANDIFPKVIRSKCSACHNDAPSFGGLAFFPGGPEVAYGNLVNKPAGNEETFKCKGIGLMRVAPGDPENSLMYLKISARPPCGNKMPPGMFGTATPEQIELVRQWIMEGAAP